MQTIKVKTTFSRVKYDDERDIIWSLFDISLCLKLRLD